MLNIYIKPTDEIHDSGYRMLEIENGETGRKIYYDVFWTYGDISLQLDVDQEGIIHLWSHSIDNIDDNFLSIFKNRLIMKARNYEDI